jgi:hypothetical protein
VTPVRSPRAERSPPPEKCRTCGRSPRWPASGPPRNLSDDKNESLPPIHPLFASREILISSGIFRKLPASSVIMALFLLLLF